MIQVKEINTKITKRITSVTETDNRSNNDTTKASNGLSQHPPANPWQLAEEAEKVDAESELWVSIW